MRRVTDFIFIHQYCIPIDEIFYFEQCDDELLIYLKGLAFPLHIEGFDLLGLSKAFDEFLKNEGDKDDNNSNSN